MRRFFDFILAILLFFPILGVIFVLSFLILVVDRFSPFHFQKRIGKNGALFTCYKLQTMKPPTDKNLLGEREKDELRLTKLGSFLRDHGWDELPQILNVLLGKMSLVGPRPLLPKTIDRIEAKNIEILPRIKEWEKDRQRFLPGVSGWHQIHIGVKASIVDCDLEYSRLKNNPSCFNFGFWLANIKIFLVTSLVFFLGKERYGKIVN